MKLFLKIICCFIFSLLLVAICLSLLDKILGFFTISRQPIETAGSDILPGNISVQYNTFEFNVLVKTNSLGFRDEEHSFLKPANTIRILTIGDSFTFGWGVEKENSWPNILEANLKKIFKNKRIEVINLAKPGLSPKNYLDMVKQYGGKFEEDIILIGILEGDDTAQLAQFTSTKSNISSSLEQKRNQIINEIDNKNKKREQTRIILQKFLPNILRFLSRYTMFSANNNWVAEVRTFLSQADDEGLKKFSKIDPYIQKQLIDGRLNSALLWDIMYSPSPHPLLRILDKENTEIIDANNRLSEILKEIKNIESQNKAEVFIIDIPHPTYVSRFYKDRLIKLGLDYDDNAWNSAVPSESIKMAAEKANLVFIPTLDDFRKTCQNDCYHFYDGHFNKKGNILLAQLIENRIKEKINTIL